MKYLSSEVFPSLDLPDEDMDDNQAMHGDIGSETQDKSEGNVEDDLTDSEKNEDQDETTNCFEALHANFAPSRRLRPFFFEEDTLVQIFS